MGVMGMKRVPLARKATLSALGVIALLVMGCGSSSTSPSSPSQPTFTAQLLPSNEVPPAVGPETAGSGMMTITFNETKDAAGNVTAVSASFVGNCSGFPPGTKITAAHIHPGAAGAAGSPIISLALTQGQIVFTDGSGSIVVSSINVDAALAQAIIANPSGYYFNIHTAANPGGAARGQLVRVQ